MGASWVVARRGGVVVRSATKIDPANPRGYARNKGGIEVPYPNVHMDYTADSAKHLARAENYQQGIPERPFSRLVISRLLPPTSGPPPGDHGRLDAGRIGHVRGWQPSGPERPVGRRLPGAHGALQSGAALVLLLGDTTRRGALFKGYDSDTARNAAPPHSSFTNTALGARAVPRESVEGRFFVYYD